MEDKGKIKWHVCQKKNGHCSRQNILKHDNSVEKEIIF